MIKAHTNLWVLFETNGYGLTPHDLDYLQAVDCEIPFTLLAFFPEFRMKDCRSPNVKEMVTAYRHVKATGLMACISDHFQAYHTVNLLIFPKGLFGINSAAQVLGR